MKLCLNRIPVYPGFFNHLSFYRSQEVNGPLSWVLACSKDSSDEMKPIFSLIYLPVELVAFPIKVHVSMECIIWNWSGFWLFLNRDQTQIFTLDCVMRHDGGGVIFLDYIKGLKREDVALAGRGKQIRSLPNPNRPWTSTPTWTKF